MAQTKNTNRKERQGRKERPKRIFCFVATALAGQADYLVSEDNDLLALGRGVRVPGVNVREFLRIMEEGD